MCAGTHIHLQPPGVFLFGNILHEIYHGWIHMDRLWRRQLNSIYLVKRCSQMIVKISDRLIINKILIDHFDHFNDRYKFGNIEHDIFDMMLVQLNHDIWKPLRDLSNSLLASSYIRNFYQMLIESSEILVNDFKLTIETDIKLELNRHTLRNIAWLTLSKNFFNTHEFELMRDANDFARINYKNVVFASLFPKCINNMIGVNIVLGQNGMENIIKSIEDYYDIHKSERCNSLDNNFITRINRLDINE